MGKQSYSPKEMLYLAIPGIRWCNSQDLVDRLVDTLETDEDHDMRKLSISVQNHISSPAQNEVQKPCQKLTTSSQDPNFQDSLVGFRLT
jgi:hypothetical protein